MSARSNNNRFKIITLTLFALVGFAANSILCRIALGEKTIDASRFTVIRLLSGALVLAIIMLFRYRKLTLPVKGSWLWPILLFLYAAPFSFAFNTLTTGTGALILFGTVQITIILLSCLLGHKLNISEWIGVFVALMGFVYLVLPGVSRPSLTGFFLMTIAGIAWGVYTLRGRDAMNPLADTAYNFIWSIPLVLILAVVTIPNAHLSSKGILLAVLSGGLFSGIGYTIWYIALRGLSGTQAAVVQLAVPVLAAFGGVIFVSEIVDLRLLLSASLILTGIILAIVGKQGIKMESH